MPDGGVSLNIREYPSGVLKHRHDYAQMIIPITGVMSIRIEDFNGLVHQNMMAIVPNFHTHEFQTNKDSRFIVLDWPDIELLGKEFSNITNNSKSKIFYLSSFLSKFFRFVSHEMLIAPEAFKEHKSAILAGLRMVEPINEQPPSFARKLTPIENIVKKIDLNEGRIDRISMAAKEAAMSQSQFFNKFRKNTGYSPKQYQLKNILDLASQRLISSDDNISLIAMQAGYENLASFTRIFKKHFGISPSQYRFQCRKFSCAPNLQER